jgi:hypothetical protein
MLQEVDSELIQLLIIHSVALSSSKAAAAAAAEARAFLCIAS